MSQYHHQEDDADEDADIDEVFYGSDDVFHGLDFYVHKYNKFRYLHEICYFRGCIYKLK